MAFRIGGEAVSLAINYSSTAQFHSAGYAPIQVNDSYVGGMVRQYGNLSFSRVYEAGHEIPFYQPETAYRIFNRALSNMDIATGTKPTYSDGGAYSSMGEADTWSHKNVDPAEPLQFCYVLDPTTYCNADQIEAVLNGTALIQDYIVVDKNSTVLFPQLLGGSGTSSGSASPSASASSSWSASPSPATGDTYALKPKMWLWSFIVGIVVVLLL